MKKLILIVALSVTACHSPLYHAVKSNAQPIVRGEVKRNGLRDHSTALSANRSRSFTFIDSLGRESIFNETIFDKASGEMVGLRELDQIVITAESNRVAEREGKIRINFIVELPAELQSSSSQIEIKPSLSMANNEFHLETILVTGGQFRKNQERGYRRYSKFLNSIVLDSSHYFELFVDHKNLAIFIERHLPYSLLPYGDGSRGLKTKFGVSENEILEHYLKEWQILRNERRRGEIESRFNRYVKAPFKEGFKLDSIIESGNRSFLYHYSQELEVSEKSSQLKLWLSSTIRDNSGLEIKLRNSDTITYTISSFSSLVEEIERYQKRIIERRLEVEFNSNISFPIGGWRVEEQFKENGFELEKIERLFREIAERGEFYIDSISVSSFASPDGSYSLNRSLSIKRGDAIKKFLLKLGESRGDTLPLFNRNQIRVTSKSEDWDGLKELINRDSTLKGRERLFAHWRVEDLDWRESRLKSERELYPYLRDSLYPKLRRVHFKLNLCRVGMVKDTIHTNEIDTLYRRGVELLRARKYREAAAILNGYSDLNSAIAHLAMGNDEIAEAVLLKERESAKGLYLLAIIYARRDEQERAAHSFLRAKELDFKMAYRGGLDPEIAQIIERYNLNRDLFE